MDAITPEDIQRLLASRQGQSLGAGDYNQLRDLHQNLYNQRAAAQPGPWQANYYQQQPVETADTLSTGSEQQKLPWSSQMQTALPSLVRQFGSAQRPMSYGAMGNTLLANGQEYHASSGGGAPIQQARAIAAATLGAPRSEDDRWSQADQYLTAHGYDGMQKNQMLTHLFGEDPLHRQTRQHDWMKDAIAMRQKEAEFNDAHGKSIQDQYIKSAGGDDPEDILATRGTNPAMPKAFWRKGKRLAPDAMNPDGREIPGEWVDRSDPAMDYMMSLRRAMGMRDGGPQNSKAALAAEFQQLHAERTAANGGNQNAAPALPPAHAPTAPYQTSNPAFAALAPRTEYDPRASTFDNHAAAAAGLISRWGARPVMGGLGIPAAIGSAARGASSGLDAIYRYFHRQPTEEEMRTMPFDELAHWR